MKKPPGKQGVWLLPHKDSNLPKNGRLTWLNGLFCPLVTEF